MKNLAMLLTIIRTTVAGVLCYMCCKIIGNPVGIVSGVCSCIALFFISFLFNLTSIILTDKKGAYQNLFLAIANFFINLAPMFCLFATGHVICAVFILAIAIITAILEYDE